MNTVLRLASLSTLLVATLVVTGCAQSSESDAVRATPVRVAESKSGPGAPVIRTNGMLVNKDEMRLSFKVGGVVSRITVQEGQRVKRGQRLAEIEQAEINAQVEQAKQTADKAQRDVARAEKLYGDHLISLNQLEDLRTQAAVSKAALQSAEFNWGYASITAPQDGTILRRLVQERVGLADREIVQVRMGDKAEVELDAHPGEKFPAQVTEVASGADERNGMFLVELRLHPTKLRLASGLVAKVALTPASANNADRVYVPIASIVEGDGRRASVFVIDPANGHPIAKRRAVEVAFIDGVEVALTQGLKLGEKVVTDGALYLQDGEHVLVRDAG